MRDIIIMYDQWCRFISLFLCFHSWKDRQCTHNVTLGAFVQPLLQWKGNKYYKIWVCICGLRYPACNVHMPYCHLWPARFYTIYPHYLKNGMIFEKKKVIEYKTCVLNFSKTLSETFLILDRSERDVIKSVYRYSCKVTVILIWV